MAFRLSGVEAEFPRIVSQLQVIEQCGLPEVFKFNKLRMNNRNIDRYFKGEREGVSTICATVRSHSEHTVNEMAMWAAELPIVSEVLSLMYSGELWMQEVARKYSSTISEVYIGSARETLLGG